MLLPLAYYGHPNLRKKCCHIDEITSELIQLVADMEETMTVHHGIGLAAPQINRLINLFITKVPIKTNNGLYETGNLRVFINPKILFYSSEVNERTEGCLSIPTLYGNVLRPTYIKVEYTNLEGKICVDEFEGLEARCVLHENDHINGVLFIDRIKGNERRSMEPLLKKIKMKYHLKE